MDQATLDKILEDLPLGAIKYFDSVGSTNEEATLWAESGSPDYSLVIADEQTAGRGRLRRSWYTPPGAALAFSLIIKSHHSTGKSQNTLISRMTGLGALAVCEALLEDYSIPARIKWPNDVLVRGKKLAGVLVEARWAGSQLNFVILGVGVNVLPDAVPPSGKVSIRATSVVDACSEKQVCPEDIDRSSLLHLILKKIFQHVPRLESEGFIHTWENRLEDIGKQITVTDINTGETTHSGQIIGLGDDGCLMLCDHTGEVQRVYSGNVRTTPEI